MPPHKPVSPPIEQQQPPNSQSACTPPSDGGPGRKPRRAPRKPRRQAASKKSTSQVPNLKARTALAESSNEDIHELLAQLARFSSERVLENPNGPAASVVASNKSTTDQQMNIRIRKRKLKRPTTPTQPPPPTGAAAAAGDPSTRDIQKLLSTFMNETDWGFNSAAAAAAEDDQLMNSFSNDPGYVPHVPPPNLKASAPLPASYILPSPNFYDPTRAPPPPSLLEDHLQRWRNLPIDPPQKFTEEGDDDDSGSLIDAPPPGIALGAHELIEEASLERERQRSNLHKVFLRKVDPSTVPLVLTAPVNITTASQEAAAKERLQVATYQSDFPTLGEGGSVIDTRTAASRGRAISGETLESCRAPTTSSTSIRPLTKADREEPYPKNWLKPPTDIDVDAAGLWMNAKEIAYIARQQVSQTARAQQDFSRPKTLQRDDTIVVTAGMERDFILNTPPKGCVCYMTKSCDDPIFGICKSRYCGKGFGEINRAISSRIKLCHDCLDSAEEMLFAVLLDNDCDRLIDILSKEIGREKVCDIWFVITAQGHIGRFEICHNFLRSSCLLSYICVQIQKEIGVCERLRNGLSMALASRSVPRDFENAEILNQALHYEIELASIDELRLTNNYWVKLGLLILLTLVDELRENQEANKNSKLARLIYEGIVDTLKIIIQPTGMMTSAMIKNPLKIHPGLKFMISSTFFLTLMTLIYSKPSKLQPTVNGIAPPALANSPITDESGYRLLYRLSCLGAVESLDENIQLTESRLFLKSSIYCAGTDNFCASALHETCGQSRQFGSAEKLVIWVCDKIKT